MQFMLLLFQMSKNTAEVEQVMNGESGDQGLRGTDSTTSVKELRRTQSIVIHRLPLQEAMKNGNSKEVACFSLFWSFRQRPTGCRRNTWTLYNKFEFRLDLVIGRGNVKMT